MKRLTSWDEVSPPLTSSPMLIGFDIFVVYCASVMAAPFMSELLQKSAFRLTASAETHVMSSASENTHNK